FPVGLCRSRGCGARSRPFDLASLPQGRGTSGERVRRGLTRSGRHDKICPLRSHVNMLSNSTFDVPKAQWEAAKAEAKEVMSERAKVRGMIAYSDLVPRIHAFAMNAHDPRLFHLLGQISSEEDAAGMGMLTVIAFRNVSTILRQPAFEFKLGFSAFGLAG